ncbi:MOSC domain-containing protein [Methylobacterium oxalidis]|uniref:MOSC domain-containing protein n=1 Tax=Methylobacterium oxalidis TaxID=944322 RepID=UPI003314CC2A
MTSVDQILTGQVAPLGSRNAPSGIDKRPVAGRVFLSRDGLTGDAQGDRKYHGGPDKALHHYAFEHYAFWIGTIGEREVLTRPGAFGENLSTSGLTESGVAIGDTFRLGRSVIQVSQGRQPCWKLDVRFDVRGMAVQVQQTGLTGWYYRVIEEGFIEEGDELLLEERLSPDWTIARIWRILYVDTMNRDELAAMAALDHLPESWRGYAAKRLRTHRVEDWSRRLNGDPADGIGEGPARVGAALGVGGPGGASYGL